MGLPDPCQQQNQRECINEDPYLPFSAERQKDESRTSTARRSRTSALEESENESGSAMGMASKDSWRCTALNSEDTK
jgi:hypothetical protein